jgi:hypothetical protein
MVTHINVLEGNVRRIRMECASQDEAIDTISLCCEELQEEEDGEEELE